jgi:O-antigen/teichoic acid export membrane protein
METLSKSQGRTHSRNIGTIVAGVQKLVEAGFLDLLLSQIFVQGGSYILQFIVAAVVGAEEFAPIKVAESWLALAILPAAFGMPTAMIKHVAEGSHSDESVLNHGLAVVVLSSLIVTVFTFVTVSILASPQTAHLVRILVWSLAFSTLTRTVLAYFQGLKEIKKAARINTVLSTIGLAVTLGLTHGFNIKGWLIGRFLSEVLFAAWMLSMVRGRVHFARLDRTLLGNMTRMGTFAMLSLLVGRAALQGDVLVLDRLIEDQILIGNYGIASLARSGLMLPAGAIAAVMLPYLVEKLRDISQGIKLFLQMAAYGLATLILLSLVVLLFPNSLFVALVGQDYVYTLSYIRGLLPAIACGALLIFTNNFLIALDRTDLAFYTFLVGLVINLALNYLLIRSIGVLGSIVAANVTYIVELVAQSLILAILVRKAQIAKKGALSVR